MRPIIKRLGNGFSKAILRNTWIRSRTGEMTQHPETIIASNEAELATRVAVWQRVNGGKR